MVRKVPMDLGACAKRPLEKKVWGGGVGTCKLTSLGMCVHVCCRAMLVIVLVLRYTYNYVYE